MAKSASFSFEVEDAERHKDLGASTIRAEEDLKQNGGSLWERLSRSETATCRHEEIQVNKGGKIAFYLRQARAS